MTHQDVQDKRSEKIIFLSHCCLNQNAKVRGIAQYPGVIRPLVEILLEAEVGMYQMPCPEMTYLGNMRWGQVKDQYNNPMFRRHCKRIAEEIVDQAENYIQCGYEILGFVMMDGSPVCGLNRTPRPKHPDKMWGGMMWYIPESDYCEGQGNFCEVLLEELKLRSLDHLPFVAAPEFGEAGDFDHSMDLIRQLIQRGVD